MDGDFFGCPARIAAFHLLSAMSPVHGTNGHSLYLVFVFVSSRMHITNESIAKGTDMYTHIELTTGNGTMQTEQNN